MSNGVYIVGRDYGQGWSAVYFNGYSSSESEEVIKKKIEFAGYKIGKDAGGRELFRRVGDYSSPEAIESLCWTLMLRNIPVIIQWGTGVLKVQRNNLEGRPAERFEYKEYSKAVFNTLPV
jgi:hypothetical protein